MTTSNKKLMLSLLTGNVIVRNLQGETDAVNLKKSLLKHWKKMQMHLVDSDGKPDPETENLTVGFTKTEVPTSFIFELRKKKSHGLFQARTYCYEPLLPTNGDTK